MAIKNTRHEQSSAHPDGAGFALLVAIIFMSVMLTFGLALGSLGYKQSVLASGAVGSQYAFYVADAALECVLHADQQQNLFAHTLNMSAPPPAMVCDGAAAVSSSVNSHTTSEWVVSERFSLDNGRHCADVMVSKPAGGIGLTSLFAQGYDVPCTTVDSPSGARFSSRGLFARYSGSTPAPPPPPVTPTFIAAASDYRFGSVTYPADAAVGDLLVLFINSGVRVLVTPPGWTRRSNAYISPSHGYGYGVFTKIKGAESSVAYETLYGGAHLLVYRGAAGVGAAGPWAETPDGPTVTLPSVTPQVTNSVIVGYLSDRDPGTCSPSAGWSTRMTNNFAYFCNVLGEKAFGSTAPTGSQTWNGVDGLYAAVGIMVEVRP